MDTSLLQIDEEKERKNFEKYANFTYLLHFWMKALEEGKSAASFFQSRGYSEIAIYGMGILGEHLKTQLERSGCTISYTIDKSVIYCETGLYDLKTNTDRLQTADVIVVTPIIEYVEIRRELKKYANIDIVSLEEVILSI